MRFHNPFPHHRQSVGHRSLSVLKKAIPLSLFTIALLCSSCSNGSETTERDRLLIERDSLNVLAELNQQQLQRMTQFFDEVASCIDSISEQEALLATQIDVETNRRYSQREIDQRLFQLSEIINGQRQRIQSLVDSLNNRVDSVKIGGLRNTITFLTKQLTQKEEVIRQLRAEIKSNHGNIRQLKTHIDNLSTSVSQLSEQNSALSEAVLMQTEIINEGYVLVATKQQLKDMGVIEGGGFLRKSKLNLGNLKTSKAMKVDIASFNEMPINSKKIKLLTAAPASSYSIISNGATSTLKIKDANAFWSISNILVIQIQ